MASGRHPAPRRQRARGERGRDEGRRGSRGGGEVRWCIRTSRVGRVRRDVFVRAGDQRARGAAAVLHARGGRLLRPLRAAPPRHPTLCEPATCWRSCELPARGSRAAAAGPCVVAALGRQADHAYHLCVCSLTDAGCELDAAVAGAAAVGRVLVLRSALACARDRCARAAAARAVARARESPQADRAPGVAGAGRRRCSGQSQRDRNQAPSRAPG
mmetsp:Transcript_10731/g.34090  ORF Transcript_10731/g.34090 Transcript_10731/m.34090 type:complete len:215 (-) Transcript_10731:75-719(-)